MAISKKMMIVGNWKMNIMPGNAAKLAKEMLSLVKGARTEIVICPPYVDINEVSDAVKGTVIKVGAQNCHWETSGAFTGEVSPEMLKKLDVSYVIIGHSERKQYFGETDKTINMKIKKALSSGLNSILCVGETLQQREKGTQEQTVLKQIKEALDGITAEAMMNITIAYEPIWAIGTGKTASSDQAEQMCGFIRSEISKIYDVSVAQGIIILYGGSMGPVNAEELLCCPNINGGLIGGSSLKPHDFAYIIQTADGKIGKEIY